MAAGGIGRARMGQRARRAAARRRATGSAPRPIRSRAGRAKSSSASSPSTSFAFREPDRMMTLTDDQTMLQDSVAPFMADEGAIKTQLRHWRDIGCKDGFGHGLWKQFAELGLTGILIPEAQGGAGLGMVEAGVVLEEVGRNLTPSPFLTTAVAAVRALDGSRAGRALVSRDRRGRYRRRAGDRRGQASRPRARRADGQAVGQWLHARRGQAVRRPRRERRRHPGRGAHRGRGGRARRADPVRGRARARTASSVDNLAHGRFVEGGAADLRRGQRRCRRGGRRGRWRLGAACRARSTRGARGRRPSWSGWPSGAAAMTLDYLKPAPAIRQV